MPADVGTNRPGFAIVGAPKTGTSALFAWLSRHPEIYTVPEKELHFFDVHRDRGRDWYRERFDPAGDRIAGEGSPSYLAHPTAVRELAELNPSIRLIVMVRDPAARTWSDYHYGVSRSWYHEPFEVRLIRELGRLLDGRPIQRSIVDASRYGHHLERALAHVPGEQILVISQEDLDATPAVVFERVCRFLGVDDGVRPDNLGSREVVTHHVRFPRLFPLLLRVNRRLPERARMRPARLLAGPGYPDLPPGVRSALEDLFAADQALLAELVGSTADAEPAHATGTTAS